MEALVRVAAVLEQQADVLDPVVVDRGRNRVRAVDLRAVLEQDPGALGALRLGRVVERLAVIRVRAGFEQRPRQLRVVPLACGTVERGHLPVLVDEEPVRIGAALEQGASERRRLEARVAGVDERRPAERATGARSGRRPTRARARSRAHGSRSSSGAAASISSARVRRPSVAARTNVSMSTS